MLRVADKGSKTDPGQLRPINEDSSFARSPLFVVADGMGGAQAGEVASATAIEVFQDGLVEGQGSVEERLVAMVSEANVLVHRMSVSDQALSGMGTTTTAAYVGENDVALAHVGDSRAYLLRDRTLQRLTDDHTLVGEFVRQGKLTPEEAEIHPQRSIITRALGPEEDVEVDHFSVGARDGDLFLLCSDGLTGMIPEAEVELILNEVPELDRAADALVQAANDAGGRDNITVILFRLEEVGGAATSDDETMVGTSGPTTAEVRAAVEAAGPAEQQPVVESKTVAREPRPPSGPPQKPRKHRRWLTALVVAAIILVPLVGGAYIASQAVYFLGVASNGSVAVFQGLPWDLPFGLKLYTSAYVTGLTPAQLPAERRKQLLNHKLRSHDDAFDLARQLELGRVAAR